MGIAGVSRNNQGFLQELRRVLSSGCLSEWGVSSKPSVMHSYMEYSRVMGKKYDS